VCVGLRAPSVTAGNFALLMCHTKIALLLGVQTASLVCSDVVVVSKQIRKLNVFYASSL
jgi:hypothetical protein